MTFRAGGAAFTAFLFTLFLGPSAVRILIKFQATAPGHLEGLLPPEELDPHKKRVPTMGGIFILVSIILAVIFWANPNNSLVVVFLCFLTTLGLLGFMDDYRKVIHQNKEGLPGHWKFSLQILIALVAVWCLYLIPETGENIRKLMIPFIKYPIVEEMWPWLALSFSCLVVVASSNAVNLSDGMDGLAIGCTIICAITYAIFAYFCGHKFFAAYLQIPFVPGCSEVVVIATAIAGSRARILMAQLPASGCLYGGHR